MLLTVRRGYRPLAGPVPGVSRVLYPSHEHSGRTDGAVEAAAPVLWIDAVADAVGLCC